jgi:hypothetical protein
LYVSKNKEDVSISFSEVEKELLVEHEHPVLEKDGDITFDDVVSFIH